MQFHRNSSPAVPDGWLGCGCQYCRYGIWTCWEVQSASGAVQGLPVDHVAWKWFTHLSHSYVHPRINPRWNTQMPSVWLKKLKETLKPYLKCVSPVNNGQTDNLWLVAFFKHRSQEILATFSVREGACSASFWEHSSVISRISPP